MHYTTSIYKILLRIFSQWFENFPSIHWEYFLNFPLLYLCKQKRSHVCSRTIQHHHFTNQRTEEIHTSTYRTSSSREINPHQASTSIHQHSLPIPGRRQHFRIKQFLDFRTMEHCKKSYANTKPQRIPFGFGWSAKVGQLEQGCEKKWDEDSFNDVNLKVILLGSSRLLLKKKGWQNCSWYLWLSYILS